jgi:hypothetical protein
MQDAALWSHYVRLSDLEAKFTCKASGRRSADVRPLFERAGRGRADIASYYEKRCRWALDFITGFQLMKL